MDYMTLKEAAEKWGVTPRRVFLGGGEIGKKKKSNSTIRYSYA